MNSLQQWKKWLLYGNASIPKLLIENYKKIGLSDMEMMLIIHIHSICTEDKQPSLEHLQERMACSELELTKILNRLRKENYMEIHTSYDPDGRANEYFSLEPLWEVLFKWFQLFERDDDELAREGAASTEIWPDLQNIENKPDVEGQIFKRFEQEFGRTLSPMECETITIWLDENNYAPAIILLALKEAVISNKLSLRYIDRILFEWQKHDISTIEEAREHTKNFRRQQAGKSEQQKPLQQASFPFYNWLEK